MVEFLCSIPPAALVALAVVAIAVIVFLFARTAARRRHHITLLTIKLRQKLNGAGFVATSVDFRTLAVAKVSELSRPIDYQLDDVDRVVRDFFRRHNVAVYSSEPNDNSLCHLTVQLPARS